MSKPLQPPPPDFDENPVWTEEMHARARPASEVFGHEIAQAMIRPRGRPALPASARKQHLTLRLSPDVIDALRRTGRGWQTRAEQMLRDGLAKAETTEGKA